MLGFFLLLYQVASLSRIQATENLQQKSHTYMNRYILSLQQKLDRFKDLPRLLSTHSELINPLLYDWSNDAKMRANLHLEKVNEVIGASDTYLMNNRGDTIASSNWSSERSFVGRNFSFRPYFQSAILGETGQYFALGTTSGKRGYFFAYPIEHRGEILGVTVVKIDLNEIEEDWSDASTDLLVTDDDGVIFISTRSEWKFQTLYPLKEQDKQRVLESKRYGEQAFNALNIVQTEPLDQVDSIITLVDGNLSDNQQVDQLKVGKFLLQQQPVPDTGLNVVILASTQPVSRQVISTVMLAASGYVALVLLVMVVRSRRKITRDRATFKARELASLERNEARIRSIIDNTQAGLITLDTKGQVDSLNNTAERLFGYRERELQGFSFQKLFNGFPEWQGLGHREGSSHHELMFETEAVNKEGHRFPVEVAIGNMPGTGNWRFILTIHDITVRKEYEQALRKAQEELEQRVDERTRDLTITNAKLVEEVTQHKDTQDELIQTAKMAVLGQMSAGINHELNQPLTAIRAYSDNAQQFLTMGREETALQNLQEISLLTERMAKIIHPLKEFSRKTSGKPEPVCLKSVRDGAMSILYGRLSKEQVEIHWPDALDLVYVMGDIVRIEQVLVNLLDNAIQAMEGKERKQIDICLEPSDDYLALTIRDYGAGIPESDLQRVFEPFYTTKSASQGLGLGLSISHRIITNMGGVLEVSNHPDGGAIFRLSLPPPTAAPTKE